MPESSNNNTNELSAGSGVGLNNFSNYTSRSLDVARSRGNYQSGIKDDKQLQAFRDVVYKMVSTWLYEDKIRIVAEYGDSEFLKKNPKEKDLNAVCTESLIIHLPKSDLQKLVADTRVKENKLKKDVKEAEKNRNEVASSFTIKNPMDYAATNSPKKIEKAIQSANKEFKIPKDIKRQFSKLEKELREVLNECYTGATLASLGNEMGIDLNTNDTTIKQSIINKTLLYVALVTGSSKSTAMMNAFVSPAPYNSLLHFTSYSYLTGEPGMDMNAWKKLRDDARKAKRSLQILTRMRRERARTNSAAFRSLSGGNRSARSIASNDIGILKDATMDQLITLAGRYGIDVKNRNIGSLKRELYRAMAANNQAIDRANRRITYSQNRGRMPNQGDVDSVSIRSAGVFRKSSDIDEGDLPIVKFSSSGIRITEKILRAVPVYVIGNGAGANSAVIQKVNPALKDTDGNVVGNRNDTSTTRKALTGRDLMEFTRIMNYSETELAEFEEQTLHDHYRVREDILDVIRQDRSMYQRKAMDIWMYGDCISSRALCDYAIKNMGAHKLTNYQSGTRIGRAIRSDIDAVKDLGKSIGNAVTNIFRQIRNHHNMRHGRHIANFNDLPEEAQDYYYTVSSRIKKDDNFIMNELTSIGWSANDNSENKQWGISRSTLKEHGVDTDDISDIYIMLSAWSHGQKMLANYLEGQLKTKYPELSIRNFYRLNHRRRQGLTDFFSAPSRAMRALVSRRGTRTNENRKNDIFSIDTAEDVAKKNNLDLRNPNAATGGAGNAGSVVPKNSTNVLSATNIEGGMGDVHSKVVQVGDNSNLVNFPGLDNINENDDNNFNSKYMSTNSKDIGIKNNIAKALILPTYIVNSELDNIKENAAAAALSLENINNNVDNVNTNLQNLMKGLTAMDITGTGTGAFKGAVTLPNMAIAQTLADTKKAAEGIANSAKYMSNAKAGLDTTYAAHTGARITRFASGGTAAITGDAAGNNIFANGAKPELVQSTGDMKVTPLNQAGSTTKQKVNRMTATERNSALATAISSHVVKVSYTLPSGAQDVSNPGEALKVYDVRPGITDTIDTGDGSSVSLIGLVASIYSQLTAITGLAQTSGSVLNMIAANTAKIGSNSTNTTGGNPFAGGFPTSLDSILAGE